MAPCDGYKRLTRQVANYLEVKLTPCDGYKRLTRQVVNFLQRKFAAGDGYKRLTRPDVNLKAFAASDGNKLSISARR